MERYEEIEKDIVTTYRKKIWNKFIKAIREFEMIQDGDKIAVCISGGKDSMLLAKCMQELKRHRKMNFELVFLVMDPGYNKINRQKIINNAKLLNKNASCLMSVVDSKFITEIATTEQRQSGLNNMIRLALDSAIKI